MLGGSFEANDNDDYRPVVVGHRLVVFRHARESRVPAPVSRPREKCHDLPYSVNTRGGPGRVENIPVTGFN